MRSRQSQPLPSPQRTVFSGQYGTVRVYTRRHIRGCLLTSPDQQHCPCPKWIYCYPRGGKPRQESAMTPSFTEACEKAQKMLKGFDPEIQAARAIVSPTSEAITIQAAFDRYLALLRSRKLDADYLGGIVLPVFARRAPRPLQPCGKPRGRRVLNMSLLDFIDFTNRTAAVPILRLEQVSSDLLDRWTEHWESNDMTSKQWRTTATAFFKWALNHGHLIRLPVFDRGERIKQGNRCGYFTDEEQQRILAALPFYKSLTRPLPANYHARLRCFFDLGRWAGMAGCDIVLFNPKKNLGANNVITYTRRKTEQIAVIVIAPAIAARLRAIPLEPGCSAEQPFRFRDLTEDRSRGIWRDRFQKLCESAGITEIETEIGTRRRPHPHMLRDTFAIDAITRRVDITNVAKMLGHATTEMTQRAYLFWIKKRMDYCIEDQRAALARVDVAPVDSDAGGAGGEGHTGHTPLIH
jgi:integrase